MAETYMTKNDVQDLLEKQSEMFMEFAKQMTKLNPVEQRTLDEAIEKEKRRAMAMIEFGKVEEEAERRKRENCSHMRYPATAGRMSGHGAPRGTLGAEWCTGGQAYQNGTATLICQRCSTTWLFRPSPEYYTAIVQNGLMGEAPPPEKDTLCFGCYQIKPECKCKEMAQAFKAA